MKLYFLFIFMVLFSSCEKRTNIQVSRGADAAGKLSVTSVLFPAYDFVREIAGDTVKLRMLLPPGAESHSYEPTPQDIVTIQNSQLFIYAGGESDAWIERILDSIDTSNIRVLSLIDCVDAVEEKIVEGMQEDEDEEESSYDEHIWTSPRNAARIVTVLRDRLCELDALNAERYTANANAYLQKLAALDTDFATIVAGGKRRTLVFGDRFPFRYFADAYGLEYYAAFPGCSTETECSAGTLAFLINKIKSEQIPVVFHIELSNEKIADAIVEATGAQKLLLHACHNISKAEFEAGKTYLDFMHSNSEALKKALY